eukprot:CAMPEP_0206426210 /NCGR_PEP_ID=MMETSP0324_2-20121206/4236_1 /ASSEMBLY_ACC=CAM_ASM_000836 /TAXON_ID=2866 /ORGANISM="Crypthecodinium cohnii, Strain Seligo" /LENGTH=331 /DNA_ID=CAMNT_0053891109 /DNA_START=12 /DNA_END=1007 /DNA_ORIENTATION=-
MSVYSTSFDSRMGMQPTSSVAMSLTQARRMPCLARGWRTPDPSPTRGLSDLPSCKPGSWWAVYDEEDLGNAQTEVYGRSDTGCDVVEERGRSIVRRCDAMSEAGNDEARPAYVPTRTPSPVPYLSVAQKENYDLAISFMRSKTSHSMSFSTVCPESEGSGGDFTPRASLQLTDDQRSATSPAKVSTLMSGEMVMTAAGSTNSNGSRNESNNSSSSNAYVAPPPPAPPVNREFLGLPDDCPSVGSLNHPHSCADFCKYAKKSRGCKDGAACSRCHICTTKKCNNQGFRLRHGYGRDYNNNNTNNTNYNNYNYNNNTTNNNNSSGKFQQRRYY